MKYPLGLCTEKTEQTYQRVEIARDLVEGSLGSLMDISSRVEGIQEPLQDLSVVLYELSQLSQELQVILQSAPLS